eukprot:6179048-Amphidinium_carterae.1
MLRGTTPFEVPNVAFHWHPWDSNAFRASASCLKRNAARVLTELELNCLLEWLQRLVQPEDWDHRAHLFNLVANGQHPLPFEWQSIP